MSKSFKIDFKTFFNWSKDVWRGMPYTFLFLLFWGLVSGFFEAYFPVMLKNLIDGLNNCESTESPIFFEVCKTGSIHLAAYSFFGIFIYFYPGLRGVINYKLETIIRARIFKKLLNKNKKFYYRFTSGDLLTRLTDDIIGYPKTSWFLCSGIFRAFNAFCILGISLFFMLGIHVYLTLYSFLLLPVAIGAFLFVNKKIGLVYKNKQKSVSQTVSTIESSIASINVLKSYRSEKSIINKFEKDLENRRSCEIDAIKIDSFFSSFFPNLSFGGQLMIIFFGSYLVQQKSISIGDFYAFLTYLTFLFFCGIDIVMFFVSGRQASVSVSRLIELEKTGYTNPKGDLSFNDKSFLNNIDINNISLKSPENSNLFLLNNISFSIPGGSWIAIVGPIGSGKTMLLEIIAGILIPDEGKIYFNGNELYQFKRSSISQMRTYVSAEPSIFSQSIRNNIKIFRDFSEDQIIESAETAQIIDEINQMPEGFNQLVGESGIGLSGGQKQRISIARGLINKPSLVILDDVTSALDAEKEESFFNRIMEKHKGVTCIYATHRLIAAQRADLIICLEKGNIIGSGSHEYLIQNCSIYSEMVNNQFIK